MNKKEKKIIYVDQDVILTKDRTEIATWKDIEIGCYNGHDRINALIGSVMKLAYHNNHSSLKPH